jgi:hypothetical protein
LPWSKQLWLDWRDAKGNRLMAVEPTWAEVEARLQTTNATTAIALAQSPPALLLVDPGAASLALVAQSSTPPSGVSRLARGLRFQPHAPGQAAIWIDDATLLRPGFDFLAAVARRMRDHGEPLREAVESQLEVWRDLVAAIHETEARAAVGVLGELAFLRAALELQHHASCWVGMTTGEIDFRFGALECEIKTSTGSHHDHVIHGDNQLAASPGSELVLVSILIASAEDGNGTSIVQLIDDLAKLGIDQVSLEDQLAKARSVYVTDPIAHAAFVLRSAPEGFAVGPEFPALTAAAVRLMYPLDFQRIRDVQYRLRLDGLPISTNAEVVALLANVRL